EADFPCGVGHLFDLFDWVRVHVDDVVEQPNRCANCAFQFLPVDLPPAGPASLHMTRKIDRAEVAGLIGQERLFAARIGRLEVRSGRTIGSNSGDVSVDLRYVRHGSKVLIPANLREPFHESDETLSRQGAWVLFADVVHECPVQSPVGPSTGTSWSAAAANERVTRPQDTGLVRNDVGGVDHRSWTEFQPFLFSIRNETDFRAERSHAILVDDGQRMNGAVAERTLAVSTGSPPC